jgi:hypothetical protein
MLVAKRNSKKIKENYKHKNIIRGECFLYEIATEKFKIEFPRLCSRGNARSQQMRIIGEMTEQIPVKPPGIYKREGNPQNTKSKRVLKRYLASLSVKNTKIKEKDNKNAEDEPKIKWPKISEWEKYGSIHKMHKLM